MEILIFNYGFERMDLDLEKDKLKENYHDLLN